MMRWLNIVGFCALVFCQPSWVERAKAQTSAPTQAWLYCKPKAVMETLGRQIHVECSNSVVLANGGTTYTVSFIAISASDPAADRFQAMATAAIVSDKPFQAFLQGDPVSNVPGCGEVDCRTPLYYGIGASF